jgi:hypothetical protein
METQTSQVKLSGLAPSLPNIRVGVFPGIIAQNLNIAGGDRIGRRLARALSLRLFFRSQRTRLVTASAPAAAMSVYPATCSFLPCSPLLAS